VEPSHGPDRSVRQLKSYRLLGKDVRSNFPFRAKLLQGGGKEDLTFLLRVGGVRREKVDPSRVRYRSPFRDRRGRRRAVLIQRNGGEVMRFSEGGEFSIFADTVVCRLSSESLLPLAENHFLGTVAAYWLERRGSPVLHASAVEVDGAALGFLSHSLGGKTSLAAAFMDSHALLTDDLLVLEEREGLLHAVPGYPQMRMWPEGARLFVGSTAGLDRVHPDHPKRRVPVGTEGYGRFCEEPRPLRALYVVDRSAKVGEQPVFERLSRRDALMELVRHSFTPYIVEAVGLQPARIEFFSSVVERIPVSRLICTSERGDLPGIRDAVLANFQAL
jgi:hypothetical protein